MDPIDYLRNEIKSYFPESAELNLSSSFAQHRRFNFYFEITANYPFLLYLNWDGEGNEFILKCLSFSSAEILNKLIQAYPETGSKAFNIGQPKSVVSFIFRGEDKLYVANCKGLNDSNINYNEITGQKLMECIDPELLS